MDIFSACKKNGHCPPQLQQIKAVLSVSNLLQSLDKTVKHSLMLGFEF